MLARYDVVMDQQHVSKAYVPPVVDETADLDFGPLDIVFGVLTLPLLFWALMYAVSGHEALYATRAARKNVYLVLLVLEVLIVLGIVWWVLR